MFTDKQVEAALRAWFATETDFKQPFDTGARRCATRCKPRHLPPNHRLSQPQIPTSHLV